MIDGIGKNDISMMERREVVELIARERRVERIVENIARRPIGEPALQDLAQMVYAIMLEYDADKVVEMYEAGQINFFIVRIVLNQYNSTNSAFYKLFRKFLAKSREISYKMAESYENKQE